VAAAEDVGYDASLGLLAREMFAQAMSRGWDQLDDAALLQLMRQR